MGCEYEAESFALIESKDPANVKRRIRGQLRQIVHDLLQDAGHIEQ